MKQILQNYKTGELKLEDVPVPYIKSGGVLVKNRYSLISPGTERAMTDLAQKNIIGKARARPDLVKQVIDKAKRDGIIEAFSTVMNRLDVTKPLGYSSSGVVIEAGKDVDEFRPDDRVACAGAGYASHAEVIFVPKNLCVKVPEGVSLEDAACVTLGAVALHGVRIANPLLGERVAVIGLGLLGQITVQLLRTSGCEVLGIDPDPWRVSLALRLGMEHGVIEGHDAIRMASISSKGYGMDATIITASTHSSVPIELAAKISRDKATVVIVGNVGMNISREIFYKKELDLRISRSYGPGRYDSTYEEKGIDYPVGYVRWTERRNMEAFLGLIASRRLNLSPLITHCFPIEEAEIVYGLLSGTILATDPKVVKWRRSSAFDEKHPDANIDAGTNSISPSSLNGGMENPPQFLGALIEYKEGHDMGNRLQLAKQPLYRPQSTTRGSESINLGLIGSGDFVKATLLPVLKEIKGLRLKGLSTATGASAKINAKRYNFEYCTTDYHEILNDEDIDAVIIATRHDLHSRLVIKAFEKGKDVFCEKPVALSEDELNRVIEVWHGGNKRLMVGFNRRFSQFAINVKEFLKQRKEPLVMNYRINAGFIPKESWVHDPVEGGGRIIGEVCHFVDLLQFFASSRPVKVYAEVASSNNNPVNDNVNINLRFKDGSIGSITYSSSGDKSFSKERLEIFGEGVVAVIDDFRSCSMIRDGKRKEVKRYKQDKGHKAELEMFLSAIKEGKESPIPFNESAMATLVTFKIIESIKKGVPILVDD